jgi:hypothetical protein
VIIDPISQNILTVNEMMIIIFWEMIIIIVTTVETSNLTQLMKCLQIPVPVGEYMTKMDPTLLFPNHASKEILVKIKDVLGETTPGKLMHFSATLNSSLSQLTSILLPL